MLGHVQEGLTGLGRDIEESSCVAAPDRPDALQDLAKPAKPGLSSAPIPDNISRVCIPYASTQGSLPLQLRSKPCCMHMQEEAEAYARDLTQELEDARQHLQAQSPLVSFSQLAERATVRTTLQRSEVCGLMHQFAQAVSHAEMTL